jgi:hypothetical protein
LPDLALLAGRRRTAGPRSIGQRAYLLNDFSTSAEGTRRAASRRTCAAGPPRAAVTAPVPCHAVGIVAGSVDPAALRRQRNGPNCRTWRLPAIRVQTAHVFRRRSNAPNGAWPRTRLAIGCAARGRALPQPLWRHVASVPHRRAGDLTYSRLSAANRGVNTPAARTRFTGRRVAVPRRAAPPGHWRREPRCCRRRRAFRRSCRLPPPARRAELPRPAAGAVRK